MAMGSAAKPPDDGDEVYSWHAAHRVLSVVDMSDVLSPTSEKLLNDDRNAEERIAKMLFEV